jgi:maleylpyruvate isomerase
MTMQLYNYFRSSASFRVRIALNLKGLPYEYVSTHLLKDGGQHKSATFLALNPQGLIPLLVDDGVPISQSLAIIEYLEETHPTPALLPASALDRAFVRSVALSIACDIHPINNLRVLKRVKELSSEDAKNEWYRHWCKLGLEVIEQQLTQSGKSGRFCFGDTPTLADVCLVPQWFNAQRFETNLSGCSKLAQIVDNCLALAPFRSAVPDGQPDAE